MEPIETVILIVFSIASYLAIGLFLGIVLEGVKRYKKWVNTNQGVAAVFVAWPIVLLIIVGRFLKTTILNAFRGIKSF